MAKNKQQGNSLFSSFLQHPWRNLVGTVLAIISLLGAGYGAGVYMERLEWKQEKLNLTWEFQQKLQKQIDDCHKQKSEEYHLSSSELTRVATEIERLSHEK
jgi:hypothetical protein